MGTVVQATGRLNLAPIEGSLFRSSIVMEIGLGRSDGTLTLGDLRRLAEECSADGQHEAAHRLWATVAEAARRAGDEQLVTRAKAMADGAMVYARQTANSGPPTHQAERRRGVTYDYGELAQDRASGMSQAAVADKWGCSRGTVARAVRYVNERDTVLALAPELPGQIHRGLDVQTLASRYDVAPKIMRWMVSDYWDRRTDTPSD